jgi:hypothetical protein
MTRAASEAAWMLQKACVAGPGPLHGRTDAALQALGGALRAVVVAAVQVQARLARRPQRVCTQRRSEPDRGLLVPLAGSV